MKFTKELLDEMQNFDYGSLFNQELEDITPILDTVEVEKEVLTSTNKTAPLEGGYKHTLARLEMMMAEERGQYVSYEQAINN